jgi:hydroxymethylbilane synthase
MSKQIRIGTRKSHLAQWQANFIQTKIRELGYDAKIVLIESSGYKDLTTPLYEIGTQGIFTKTLDTALLNNQVDIAVHSLKDVPTALPNGLILAAVPLRANALDILVYKDNKPNQTDYTIATSSLRRKAQWLHKYPQHNIVNIRGNVNRRLEKLENNKAWNGAIFAEIGLQRLGINTIKKEVLDWMIPSPAQGALGVICRKNEQEIENICTQINHQNSNIEVQIERLILRACFGGCTLPLGAFAKINNSEVNIIANITSLDGKQMVKINEIVALTNAKEIADKMSKKLLSNGGQEILYTINQNKNA